MDKTIIAIPIFTCICGCSPEKNTKPLFRHHFIAQTLPDTTYVNYGTPGLADFDNDGDLDFAFSESGRNYYWFEFESGDEWIRHRVGSMPTHQLAGTTLDVDNDGYPDLITGGYWFRNTGNPREEEFEGYLYDSTIQNEIHDLSVADMDGDGNSDIVALGDMSGFFWYGIPDDPRQPWNRTIITMDVLDSLTDIHSGFFPNGIGDLDQDSDADIVLPGRWLENRDNGRLWIRHQLPFGSVGYWGLSCRSWILDMDNDQDMDIIMVTSDQVDSRGAWLERIDNYPGWKVHLLPLTAPGRRGSFHSLAVFDFDNDGDEDIFTTEQEDHLILPAGAPPRGYLWENQEGIFIQKIVFDENLGGHDALAGDVDGDGDQDICFKIWKRWPSNGNEGRFHADYLENTTID